MYTCHGSTRYIYRNTINCKHALDSIIVLLATAGLLCDWWEWCCWDANTKNNKHNAIVNNRHESESVVVNRDVNTEEKMNAIWFTYEWNWMWAKSVDWTSVSIYVYIFNRTGWLIGDFSLMLSNIICDACDSAKHQRKLILYENNSEAVRHWSCYYWNKIWHHIHFISNIHQ